jgi:uncharacterized OsmC-like protein
MTTETIRAALDKVGKMLAEQPEKARAKNARAIATLSEGLKFAVTGPNGETVHTDMPPGVGGSASAPNPGWLLRAALASCTSTAIAMRAAKLGINLTKLEMTVESDSDLRGLLGLDEQVSAGLSGFRSRVVIAADNATPEQLEDLVRWGDRHSPVACTLRDMLGDQIEIVVV